MYRFALLTILASVSGYVFLDSKCPEVTNVDNFNFEAYGSGVWYEVARYPDDVIKDGKCGIVKYKKDGDVQKVKYTYVNNNKLMSIEGAAKLANDAGTTGKLIHSMPYGVNGTVVDGVLNILALDYDRFFICYYCQFDDVNKSYRESAWILSRSQPLSEETEAKINKFVKESTFLNADKFVWPRFSAEDCRVEA